MSDDSSTLAEWGFTSLPPALGADGFAPPVPVYQNIGFTGYAYTGARHQKRAGGDNFKARKGRSDKGKARNGKPRKGRSDKGKPRGPAKVRKLSWDLLPAPERATPPPANEFPPLGAMNGAEPPLADLGDISAEVPPAALNPFDDYIYGILEGVALTAHDWSVISTKVTSAPGGLSPVDQAAIDQKFLAQRQELAPPLAPYLHIY